MRRSTTFVNSTIRGLVYWGLISSASGCTLVEGIQILGKDLANADARFVTIPPDFVVGFSPLPGLRRVVDVRTLTGIARQFKIEADGLTAVCFEHPTESLSISKLQPVLERALGIDGVKLEIVDFSRFPVPEGELVFSLHDLMKPPVTAPDAAVTWRGHLRYGSRSTVVIWAKVRVSKVETWVETTKAIAAHQVIQPDQLTIKSGWRFPFLSAPLSNVEAVAGKQATRSLLPGTIVVSTMLETAPEITRGDPVDVEVASGAVSLRFSARAESSGRLKDSIVVIQDETGKRYRGRVQERGKVLIDADSRKKVDAVRGQPDAGRSGDVARGAREGEEE